MILLRRSCRGFYRELTKPGRHKFIGRAVSRETAARASSSAVAPSFESLRSLSSGRALRGPVGDLLSACAEIQNLILRSLRSERLEGWLQERTRGHPSRRGLRQDEGFERQGCAAPWMRPA